MFFRVNLDGIEQVVEAGDPTDAIARAREGKGDVGQQSAVQVSDEEEEFFQSEKNKPVVVVDVDAEDVQ